MLGPVKSQRAYKPIPVRVGYMSRCIFCLIDPCPDLVQQGISEKVALVVNFAGAFICGFVLGFARSWRLALAMSSILPCIAITGGIMNKFISSYMR